MIYKPTQKTIDTLLRFNIQDNNNKPTINLIGSSADPIIVYPKSKSKSKSVGEVRELQSYLPTKVK